MHSIVIAKKVGKKPTPIHVSEDHSSAEAEYEKARLDEGNECVWFYSNVSPRLRSYPSANAEALKAEKAAAEARAKQEQEDAKAKAEADVKSAEAALEAAKAGLAKLAPKDPAKS